MLIVYMEILCTSSQIILWTKLISYEIARTVPQGADVIHSFAKFSRAGYATMV